MAKPTRAQQHAKQLLEQRVALEWAQQLSQQDRTTIDDLADRLKAVVRSREDALVRAEQAELQLKELRETNRVLIRVVSRLLPSTPASVVTDQAPEPAEPRGDKERRW